MIMKRSMCSVTRMDRIGNKYTRESLGITDLFGKMKGNRLTWFGGVERTTNDDIIMKTSKIIVEKNQERRDQRRSGWEFLEWIPGHMDKNENMFRDRERCEENIRIADPICVV